VVSYTPQVNTLFGDIMIQAQDLLGLLILSQMQSLK